MIEDTFDLAGELEAGLREAIAHRRGEVALSSCTPRALSPERVKAIRTRVARSTRDFQRRFHVSSRTVEGWEQGRPMDGPAAILMRVIEREPEAVERALADD